ncbi:MAG TPA: hypothetical protein VK512_21280, partial [Xanthobacteraceae bacterium]|nr:hypothetical protein [Xanthobacteraceae bacterium]
TSGDRSEVSRAMRNCRAGSERLLRDQWDCWSNGAKDSFICARAKSENGVDSSTRLVATRPRKPTPREARRRRPHYFFTTL